MKTKIRISKKDIKQDKFTATMLIAKDWLTERWQPVAIGVAVVVIAAVAVVYFINLQESKQLEAATRLQNAFIKMRQMNYQEAIVEFGQIVDNYGGEIGARAQFYLANAHYESRNYDEAISNYQRFIDKYHTTKLMTASAIAGVAACLENKREFLQAGDKYVEAINFYPESPSAPDYYLGAVRTYVLGGDIGKAEQSLTEMKDKFAGNEYLKTATRLLMGAKNT